MVTSVAAGEKIVQSVFEEDFEGQDFSKWNTPVDARLGQSIIEGVGRARQINVRQFIADLHSDPEHGAVTQGQPQTLDNPAQSRSAPMRDGNTGSKPNGWT